MQRVAAVNLLNYMLLLNFSAKQSLQDITFKLSGSSDLPAYPGFIVINTAHVGSK